MWIHNRRELINIDNCTSIKLDLNTSSITIYSSGKDSLIILDHDPVKIKQIYDWILEEISSHGDNKSHIYYTQL